MEPAKEEMSNGHAPAVQEPDQAAVGAPPRQPSIADKLAAAAARPFEPVPVQAQPKARPDQAAADTPAEAPIMLPNGQPMPDTVKVGSRFLFMS